MHAPFLQLHFGCGVVSVARTPYKNLKKLVEKSLGSLLRHELRYKFRVNIYN